MSFVIQIPAYQMAVIYPLFLISSLMVSLDRNNCSFYSMFAITMDFSACEKIKINDVYVIYFDDQS